MVFLTLSAENARAPSETFRRDATSSRVPARTLCQLKLRWILYKERRSIPRSTSLIRSIRIMRLLESASGSRE